MKNENNMEKIREINNEWITALEEEEKDLPNDKKLRILMYEPFTDQYWKQKYKIVLCNLEPGGTPENEKILSLKTYRKWLEEGSPTIRNTSVFIYCLSNILEGIDTWGQIETVKKNYDLLMKYVEKITYMNLLKDCGTPNFDEGWFNTFFSGEKGKKDIERTINYINTLNPDIFIVTGKGDDFIENIYKNKFNKEMRSFVNDKTLFIKLGHPSRWSKDYLPHNISLIMENMLIHNLLKK